MLLVRFKLVTDEQVFMWKVLFAKAWFPYGRKNRVTIFLNGQFIMVYGCKPHINHKYSLIIITPRMFSSKMLYFGWWERSWFNRYDQMETRLKCTCLCKHIFHDKFCASHDSCTTIDRRLTARKCLIKYYINWNFHCRPVHIQEKLRQIFVWQVQVLNPWCTLLYYFTQSNTRQFYSSWGGCCPKWVNQTHLGYWVNHTCILLTIQGMSGNRPWYTLFMFMSNARWLYCQGESTATQWVNPLSSIAPYFIILLCLTPYDFTRQGESAGA
jgi:hypothetical protein